MSSHLTWQDSIVNTIPFAAKAKNMLAQCSGTGSFKNMEGPKHDLEWSHVNSCNDITAILIPSNMNRI